MNLFDALVILLAVLFGIGGFREGFIRGGVKLAGFLFSLAVLTIFAAEIARFAIGLESIPFWVAVPGVFMAALLAMNILFAVIAGVLYRVVQTTPLGAVDNGLGMVLGTLKSLFVSGILALILSFFPGDGFLQRQYETSRAAPKLVGLISKTIPFAAGAGAKILKYLPLPSSPKKDEPQKQKHEPKFII